jgi:hypothetical protein
MMTRLWLDTRNEKHARNSAARNSHASGSSKLDGEQYHLHSFVAFAGLSERHQPRYNRTRQVQTNPRETYDMHDTAS